MTSLSAYITLLFTTSEHVCYSIFGCDIASFCQGCNDIRRLVSVRKKFNKKGSLASKEGALSIIEPTAPFLHIYGGFRPATPARSRLHGLLHQRW